MSPIRVLIADDHPLLREGVARSLAEAEGFEVSGQADTADDAVHQARDARPDVVLLDISMPGGGLSALRRIRRLEPAPLVAMLTVSEDDDDVMQALTAGAQGYILKGIGSRELVQIVRDLAAGRSYVSPSLAMKVLVAMTRRPTRNPGSTQSIA